MHGQFIVFERGQNGPLDSRAAGQMLPAGANVLVAVDGDKEVWFAAPEWPYWDQRRAADWQDAAVRPDETLGEYVAQIKRDGIYD